MKLPLIPTILLAATLLSGCGHRRAASSAPPPEQARATWVRPRHVVPMVSQARANPFAYSTQAHLAIQTKSKAVSRCYRATLKDRPRLHGQTIVALAVGSEGQVEKAWIDFSTVPSLQLEACLLEIHQDLTLPPPPEGQVEVRHPYVFTSAGTPPEITQALRRLHRLEDPEEWADSMDSQQKPDDFDAPW